MPIRWQEPFGMITVEGQHCRGHERESDTPPSGEQRALCDDPLAHQVVAEHRTDRASEITLPGADRQRVIRETFDEVRDIASLRPPAAALAR